MRDDKIMKKLLKILYQPYKWLFFAPFLVVSTLVFGFAAVALCFVMDPKIPSRLCGATWAKLNGLLIPMFVSVFGREHVDKNQSYVIVSNHQSQSDILLLYGWLGIDFKWVMKKELRKIPAIGISCEKLGHIYVDRSDRNAAIASINAAKKKIVNGTSVLFFPEGTRSRTGRLIPFKKGAFKMALDLGLPILPVTIAGTRDILPPDTADIFPGRVRLMIHRPISTEAFHEGSVGELMEKVREVIGKPLKNQ